jgi:hypothetical protein
MGDKNKFHDDLCNAILNGLGDYADSRWNNIKSRLRKANTDTDFGVTRGQTIVEELIIPCNIKDQVHNLINLCTEYDDGLFLLKNACVNIFPSGIDSSTFESSILEYALEFDNQPKLKNSFASLVSQNHIDLTWLDDLNQTSFEPARRVVGNMSRPAEPLALDDKARQFLHMLPHEDFKSALKQILGNKSQGVVDEFRKQLYNLGQDNNQTESIKYLFIFIEEVEEREEARESLFRFKAELVEQGSTIPLAFVSERENNGAWPVGPIRDLPAYIVDWYDKANKCANDKLNMEVFFPNRLLAECHNFQIEIAKTEDESNPKTLNLIFDCPFVLRSSDRAVSAQKGELGPLKRKWQSLLRGDSVLHSLTDDSEIDQGRFHALLRQDYLAGILILKNLPDDKGMRSRLIKKLICSGTPLFAWYNDSEKDDTIDSPSQVGDRLNYFDQCLGLNGVERDDSKRIKAPINLSNTEHAAHRRFNLATQTDCQSWIHRVNIFHDHPDRWPQLILYENEPSGQIRHFYN